MKKLYKYRADFGRMGELGGLFIATDDELKSIIGKETYFGEVLGKHSEIVTLNDESEFTVKSEDPDFIAKLESVFNSRTLCGFNPLDYDTN